MYQFYYADKTEYKSTAVFKEDLQKHFAVTAVRPTMWEEHCLECAAPLCFENCVHYSARRDGRCKRFVDGMSVYADKRGCCGQGMHLTFRKWANMMTVIFPGALPMEKYEHLTRKNQTLGKALKKLCDSALPIKARWFGIRMTEWLRRRYLRKMLPDSFTPDAFVFHGFSHTEQAFKLIIEAFDENTSLFRTALDIRPGENLYVLDFDAFSADCRKANNLIKMYPENNIEAELDILWCDFVAGKRVVSEKPADKVKCLVWDLDNTLWEGVLIETDEPETLAVRSQVMETVQALDARGILQSVASKNDYEAAMDVLCRLGLSEYFLYPQIHWNAKSSSMEQIAKSLNIGIDSLALIDDSTFEREQVRSVLPQVRTYDISELQMLLAKDEFTVSVTEESKNRRAMYRAEEKRNEIKTADGNDTAAFIQKCHLELTLFEPTAAEDVSRCYELVLRTNQLNMSGKKYTEKEFSAVLNREGHRSFAFSCKDDFGSYGIVGFGQYRIDGDKLIFTEFAMSCRVAGKYVESALFAHLLELEHCTGGIFEVIKTKKNALLRRTLAEIGFDVEEEGSDTLSLSYSVPLKNDSLVAVRGE